MASRGILGSSGMAGTAGMGGRGSLSRVLGEAKPSWHGEVPSELFRRLSTSLAKTNSLSKPELILSCHFCWGESLRSPEENEGKKLCLMEMNCVVTFQILSM